MRTTTVRLRPMRRKTMDQYGVDTQNLAGAGAELWVAGQLVAVLSLNLDRDPKVEVYWGTEWAAEHEEEIIALALTAIPMMLDAPERERAEA